MPDPVRSLPSLIGELILYIVASPIFVLRAIGGAAREVERRTVIKKGTQRCKACGRSVRLDFLVTCNACGYAEHRSVALPCRKCGYTPDWIPCTCGASVDLP